jgi:hypothetical protein
MERVYALLLEALAVERLVVDVSVEAVVLDNGSELDSELYDSREPEEEKLAGMPVSTPLSLITAAPVRAFRNFTCSVKRTETTTRSGRRSLEAACMQALRDRA